jgi:hypothetical protein
MQNPANRGQNRIAAPITEKDTKDYNQNISAFSFHDSRVAPMYFRRMIQVRITNYVHMRDEAAMDNTFHSSIQIRIC